LLQQLQDNLDDDEGQELLLARAIEMLTFDIAKAPRQHGGQLRNPKACLEIGNKAMSESIMFTSHFHQCLVKFFSNACIG
jgi:hypothetical protein